MPRLAHAHSPTAVRRFQTVRGRALLVLMAASLGLSACSEDKIVPAVGPGYEIVVLSPPAHRELGEAVAGILSKEIRLIRWEPSFDVIDDVLDDDSFYRTRKLLFAVAPAGDPDLERLMKRATGTGVQSSFPGLWIIREPFAAGQIMFVLTGEKEALLRVLEEQSEELLAVAEEAAVTLLMTNLFRTGEKDGARARMQELWGWGVRLPREWTVDDRFAEDGFVRVWRDAPVAQLFVSWERGQSDRSAVDWMLRRDELTGLYYQGDFIDRIDGRSEAVDGPTPFGIDGAALHGVWENEIYVIGGPFESWAFYCAEDDRTYLIDLSVYAPDREKRPLLRILEAVARTFRCGCVPAVGSAGGEGA